MGVSAHQLVGLGYLPVFCMVGVAVTFFLLHTLDVKRSRRRLLRRLAAEIGLPLGGICWLLVAWVPLRELLLWRQESSPEIVLAAGVGTLVILAIIGWFANWRIKSVLGWRGISAEIGFGIAHVIFISAIITVAWGVLLLMAR